MPIRLGRSEVLSGGSYRALRREARVTRRHARVWVLVIVNVVLVLVVVMLGYRLSMAYQGMEAVEVVNVAVAPTVPHPEPVELVIYGDSRR